MSDASGGTTFDCSGSMTIAMIESVQNRLRDLLGTATRIELDSSGITDADVCFAQLLLSARATAARRGVTLLMRQPLGAPLRDVLERGGFIAKAGASRSGDEDFWIGGQ